jgi:hypothetical protein
MRALPMIFCEALFYKTESIGFETDEVNEFFSVYQIPPAALGLEIHSASKRNKYEN